MPIYEFACGKCGDTFEVLVRSRNDPAPTCPACGSKRVTKALAAFAVGKAAAKFPPSCGACSESRSCRAAGAGGCAGGACPIGG